MNPTAPPSAPDGPVYLYGLMAPSAIVPEERLKGMPGVGGAVDITRQPEATLIFGRHDGSDILPRRRLVLAHARVLETALEAGAVLPMRFGMIADTLAQVQDLMRDRGEAITSELRRLDGLVELGVRVGFDTDQALAQQLARNPGLARERAHLAGNQRPGQFALAEFGRRLGDALDRQRTDAQHALVAGLRGAVRDIVLRRPEHEAQVLAADVLIPRDGTDRLAECLSQLARDHALVPDADPEVRLVGPVPPFNFARLSLAPDPVAA